MSLTIVYLSLLLTWNKFLMVLETRFEKFCTSIICGVLRNLVPFVPFKNVANAHGRALLSLGQGLQLYYKINTHPLVFFTCLKLYKCYQFGQSFSFDGSEWEEESGTTGYSVKSRSRFPTRMPLMRSSRFWDSVSLQGSRCPLGRVSN